jgi:hypothetical protein
MRKVLICLTALLLWAGLATSQSEKGKERGTAEGHAADSSDATSAKDSIMKMEDELREAAIKGDSSVADKYLADDYYTVSAANGQAYDKKQVIDRMKSGASKISEVNVSKRDVAMYGPNLAISHGVAEVKSTTDGKDTSGKYHFARTWTKRDGKWQAVWFQTTKVQ